MKSPLKIALFAMLATAPVSSELYAQSAVTQQAVAATTPTTTSAQKAWLGVVTTNGYYGVRVAEVVPGTPAEHAGLRAGDEVASVNGERTKTHKELTAVIGKLDIGDRVDLKIHRGSQVERVSTELSQFLDARELFQRWHRDRELPNFIGEQVSGPHSADPLEREGKVVLLYLGAGDCTSCEGDFHRLAALQAAEPDDLVVLAMSPSFDRQLQQRLGSSLSLLLDRHERVARQLFRLQPGQVAALVVGRDGHVRFADLEQGRLELEDTLAAAKLALRERLAVW